MYYINIWLIFIAENQRDFIQLLATVTNSPGSGWIEPVSETDTENLLKRSLQTLNTGQEQLFMHLEFQVKMFINLIISHSFIKSKNMFDRTQKCLEIHY